jgi:malate dehydrogenase
MLKRIDLFNTNASIVRDLAKAAADASPDANILVISNPVWPSNCGFSSPV